MVIYKVSEIKVDCPALHLKYHGLVRIQHSMNMVIKVGAMFVYLTAENNIY